MPPPRSPTPPNCLRIYIHIYMSSRWLRELTYLSIGIRLIPYSCFTYAREIRGNKSLPKSSRRLARNTHWTRRSRTCSDACYVRFLSLSLSLSLSLHIAQSASQYSDHPSCSWRGAKTQVSNVGGAIPSPSRGHSLVLRSMADDDHQRARQDAHRRGWSATGDTRHSPLRHGACPAPRRRVLR